MNQIFIQQISFCSGTKVFLCFLLENRAWKTYPAYADKGMSWNISSCSNTALFEISLIHCNHIFNAFNTTPLALWSKLWKYRAHSNLRTYSVKKRLWTFAKILTYSFVTVFKLVKSCFRLEYFQSFHNTTTNIWLKDKINVK